MKKTKAPSAKGAPAPAANAPVTPRALELWPIDRPKPYAKNPRRNDAAVEKVAASIREFGWAQPIVVDGDGVIIIGHTRLKAAKRLGLKTVPVLVRADLTPEQVAALRLADNKTAELAEWDEPLLAAELDALVGAVDMEQFGFGEELAALEPPANLDGEDADKPFVLKLTFKTAGECEKFLDAHREELDGMGAIASVSGGGL